MIIVMIISELIVTVVFWIVTSVVIFGVIFVIFSLINKKRLHRISNFFVIKGYKKKCPIIQQLPNCEGLKKLKALPKSYRHYLSLFSAELNAAFDGLEVGKTYTTDTHLITVFIHASKKGLITYEATKMKHRGLQFEIWQLRGLRAALHERKTKKQFYLITFQKL